MAIFNDRIRHVVRRLARTPLFTAITLITLAIGIGANTAIFSVIEAVLLKPLPYPEPERLIGVWHTAPGIGLKDVNMSPFLYFIDREQSRTFEDIGAYSGDSVNMTGSGEPEHIPGIDVTSGTLPLLGAVPAYGRLFTAEDDSPGKPETVILTYSYWRKRFSADPNAVGRMITLDGKPRQIIGVLPRDFEFVDYPDRAIVMPMQWDRNKTKLGNFSYEAIARLKPGVTLAQANADVARLIPIAINSFPAPEGFSAKIFESAKLTPALRPLKKHVIGDVGNVLWVLMGALALVLLIACANVANLLLVRVEGRRQELAIRVALGAGWKRVAGDLFIESSILSVTGSLLGLGLAYGALRALVAAAPTGLPRIHEIGLDLPVLFFVLALALLTSLLIGAIPVIKYAGAQLNTALRDGGRGQSQSREQHLTRNILVVFQVMLALVLLICSGLMIRTFNALTNVAPGFRNSDKIETFRISVPESKIPEGQDEHVTRTEQQILDKVASVPGVTSAALSTAIPLSGDNSNDMIFAEDHPVADGQIPPIRRFKFVSPGFFSTMGIPFAAGRDITWSETYNQVPVVIVSENLAREYWKDARSALGKRIRCGPADDWREIIGVVGDVHDDGVSQPAPASVYWPVLLNHFEGQASRSSRWIAAIIRSERAGSEAFMKQVQHAVWSVDSDLPIADAHTVGYYYTRSMARTSFTLVMLCVAGSMALALGLVGIYGVISYSVSQRTREIGIRMALGAQRQNIVSMFVRQGLTLTGIGIMCGLVAAFAAMRLMSSLLFHVSPVDPLTYITITLGTVVIAYTACYFPSRRAATVEPVNALRAE
jgi:predicted permease